METKQIIKEYSSVVIARQSALKATQSVIEAHGLKLSMKQFIRLFDRFYQFIESGDRNWVDKMDKFFKLEDNKNFNEIFGNE